MKKRTFITLIFFGFWLCFGLGCGEEKNIVPPGVPTGEAGLQAANPTEDVNKPSVRPTGEGNTSEGTEGAEITSPQAPSGKVLNWVAPYGIAGKETGVYDAFNQLLLEKGYDFNVEFIETKKDFENYTSLLYEKKKNGEKVDIFTSGFDYYGAHSSDMYLDGMCVRLNEYLETPGGQALKDSKSENQWKSTSIHGDIYGVSGTKSIVYSRGNYFYINKDLAEKYAVDINRMASDINYFWEMVDKVQKGESERENFITYVRWGQNLLSELPKGMSLLRIPLALVQGEDGVCVVNVFDSSEVRKSTIMCNRMFEEDAFLVDKLQADNYFVVISSERQDISGMIEVAGQGMAMNQEGALTCIASWAEYPEEAFELIQAIHTDRELAELLAYGIEGVHYTVEDDKICRTEKAFGARYSALFLSECSLLRASDYDMYRGPSLTEEEEKELGLSPILGMPLDFRGFQEQLQKLAYLDMYFPSYVEDSSWRGQNFEEKYDEGLAFLKENGIDEIIENLNQQLKESGLQ